MANRRKDVMHLRSVLIWALCFPALAHAAGSYRIPAELWDRPRSASLILAEPALRQAVAELAAYPATKFVIHHGAGQEDNLQAIELRSWLAALAVSAERVTLAGDLPSGEELKLEVRELK